MSIASKMLFQFFIWTTALIPFTHFLKKWYDTKSIDNGNYYTINEFVSLLLPYAEKITNIHLYLIRLLKNEFSKESITTPKEFFIRNQISACRMECLKQIRKF